MKRKTNKKNNTRNRKNNKYKTWSQSGFKIRQLGENCFMADVCLFGERERKCFKTKGEAEEHCKQKKQEAINKGTDAFAIPDQDRLDVIQARNYWEMFPFWRPSVSTFVITSPLVEHVQSNN